MALCASLHEFIEYAASVIFNTSFSFSGAVSNEDIAEFVNKTLSLIPVLPHYRYQISHSWNGHAKVISITEPKWACWGTALFLLISKETGVSWYDLLFATYPCSWHCMIALVGDSGFMIPSKTATKTGNVSSIPGSFGHWTSYMTHFCEFMYFVYSALFVNALWTLSRDKYITYCSTSSTAAYLSHTSAATFFLSLRRPAAFVRSLA